VLVLIGGTEDGSKELLAVVDGYRESNQSWRELLGQLKRLGLRPRRSWPPVTDHWASGSLCRKQEEYGPVVQQRCWVHKTANILDKMPKSAQGKAEPAKQPSN
jgi:putative transposase